MTERGTEPVSEALLPRFRVAVPEGFIPLPVGEREVEDVAQEDIERVERDVRRHFGVAEGDDGAAVTAAALVTTGVAATRAGSEYAAVGIYKSTDGARPLMVQLSLQRMHAPHESPDIALAGLSEAHESAGADVRTTELPAGPAVLVERESPADAAHREVMAWVPHPGGAGVGVVALSSGNLADWADIRELALEVVDSFAWEAPAAPEPTDSGSLI